MLVTPPAFMFDTLVAPMSATTPAFMLDITLVFMLGTMLVLILGTMLVLMLGTMLVFMLGTMLLDIMLAFTLDRGTGKCGRIILLVKLAGLAFPPTELDCVDTGGRGRIALTAVLLELLLTVDVLSQTAVEDVETSAASVLIGTSQ